MKKAITYAIIEWGFTCQDIFMGWERSQELMN